MPPSYQPVTSQVDVAEPPTMLMIEPPPVFVTVPSQQLVLFESMPAAQPAFTPAAGPSTMDVLCFSLGALTVQCAHTPMASIRRESWAVQRFGRPAFDLQPAALMPAPRLPGLPSLVKPTVVASAVTKGEVMETEIVRPALQLPPKPVGQLPLPPLAPIPVPAMAVPTPLAAVIAPPAPEMEVRPQQAAVQPLKRKRVVAPVNLVFQQVPQPELVVPPRRLAAPVNLVRVPPAPVQTSPQQPLPPVQPSPPARVPRNTPAGPLNLVIAPPTLASSSRPQQAQAPKQKTPPAPASRGPSPPPIPSRPHWKLVKKLSLSEAQAKLTLPTLALPSVPKVTPKVAPLPQPAPVVPVPVVPAPVAAPLPPAAAPAISDAVPEQQAPIPLPGSCPVAPMRRRRAFGNTVPLLPPGASDLEQKPLPATVVAAAAESSGSVMKAPAPTPLPPARTAHWAGLELRTLADRLIKECVDVDAWRRRLFGDIEMYIGGGEDDDTLFSPEQASEVIKTLFRSVKSSDVGFQRQKENTLNKVVQIARKEGLMIERL
ncbi:hypothetical protein QC763_400970 [Podospora pseudopauciseta]|uniref:Uncharacterized protein n=1 Tax=Podospora pseudopauciseta TaxID=2093780 RepID=A0ABR0HBF1_9PEZI|nr:hypothetical protein QC763_400970 [Podospora pseudopauciseta]